MPICTHCKHADYAHVNGECVACGCIHFDPKPKRADQQRIWLVTVSFFEKNRWTPDLQVRVSAQSIGGAAQKAVREAKRRRESKKRILQTRITVVCLPGLFPRSRSGPLHHSATRAERTVGVRWKKPTTRSNHGAICIQPSDTETTPAELEEPFGRSVRSLVEELTDDKALDKADRKRLQIEHASTLSLRAKVVKLADKIADVGDVVNNPPSDWTLARRIDYLDWTEQVVGGCRGANPSLERFYDEVLKNGRASLHAAG